MKKTLLILGTALAISANAQNNIISTFAGTGKAGYAGDSGSAVSAELNQLTGVAVDGYGNVYIADQVNNCIRMVNPAGIISTFAGNYTMGPGYSGDGGPATAAELNQPVGVTTDASGNVYIADEDNNRIRKVNALGIISTIAGTGKAGDGGDGGQDTAAELNGPWGVAFDAAGNMYIADLYNNRIRKVNAAGIISLFAGTEALTGPGYAGDGGPATAARLNYPSRVAFDASGNVYIADEYNNRVRKVNAAGIISTFAGNGTGSYGGDGGPDTAAEINIPVGVAFDAAGNLYIADAGNNRIRIVNTAGIISTIAGNGTGGYSGDGSTATAAELNGPYEVAFDGIGNMYIADNGNNVIRKVLNVGGQSNICYTNVTVTDTLIINTNLSSINPVTYANTIKMFPNPTNSQLNIDCSPNTTGYTIKIINTLSEVVYIQKVAGSTYAVNLSNFGGAGTYFVQIYGANNNLLTVRTIILN